MSDQVLSSCIVRCFLSDICSELSLVDPSRPDWTIFIFSDVLRKFSRVLSFLPLEVSGNE